MSGFVIFFGRSGKSDVERKLDTIRIAIGALVAKRARSAGWEHVIAVTRDDEADASFRAAGATVYHSHSQLIVMPIVPDLIEEKLAACRKFFDYRGRCLLCDIGLQELEQKSRLVVDSGQFIAFEPYAARTPFETCIVPKNHASHFESINQPLCEELAYILKRVMLKIEKGLKNVAYNYMIFTAPFDAGELPHFHWHIEIVPRLTRLAGFEWGTGFYVNVTPSE